MILCVFNIRFYCILTEYSDIRIENRAYGRVYVSDHDYNTKAEVCALGFRRGEAEALCRLQGYSLKYFLKYVFLKVCI